MAESNQSSGAAGADAADAADAVPPGFKAMRPSGGFLAHLGQLYVDSGQRAVGVRIGKHHLNPLGIPHGGMLATLADTAIGMMMLMEGERMPPAVTVNLSLDYFDAARLGEWIEAHVEFDKLGSRLRFGHCRVMAGERCLLRATAIFSVLAPRT